MSREEQICSQGIRYTKETHSPSSVSEFQAAMNIAVVKAFTAGAQWADETILQEVFKWLDENFYEHECFSFDFDEDRPYECPIICDFKSKKQMFQLFKERFNIVDDCDQQYSSDFINDR